MKHKFLRRLAACGLTFALTATCLLPASNAGAVQTTKPSRVSVHDPSIIKSGNTYYVFGSHLADAKSTDLINWTQMNRDYNTRDWTNDSVYGVVLDNLSESFKWAGYDDGDCSDGGLAVWAPDVKWNPYYEWEDGKKGAYMLYYSASSTWRRSCIGYAVSKTVEGPYSYVDTIIYSGFTTSGNTDGNSTRNTKWNNDYLNLKELTDSGIVDGISARWFWENGDYNSNNAPNAIDPTIFFDKDGEMYMVYGSWSGGLFLLSLNKRTGAVNYPGKDRTDAASGNFVDRYFGTHIAGGNHQSGEGPYIIYDQETDYYYLYETYGGLLGNGGYNMRLFRSKNVTGPYLDAKGKSAIENNFNNDNFGIKLIGNYQFTGQTTGYRAAGHNSAFIDDDGSHYLIYHQRFTGNDYYHEVRVRQQFMNQDGWPVTAVYENRGEKIEHYANEDVVGIYEIINHGTATNANMLAKQKIELLSDGTVVGDLSGTWSKKTGKDYDYITISSGTVTYRGVLFRQYNEEKTPKQVMTFSTISNTNTCLWGTKIGESTQEIITPATPTPVPSQSPSFITPGFDDDDDPPIETTQPKVTLKKPSLKVKAGKKKATLTWNKISNANGYQIQYSKKSSMKSAKKVKIAKKTTTKRVIQKLTSKKTYYFRIRAYANSGGKTIYSSYSTKKKIKIK